MNEIGEKFNYQGAILQVVDANGDKTFSCESCFFNEHQDCEQMRCMPHERLDDKDVVFIEVENN